MNGYVINGVPLRVDALPEEIFLFYKNLNPKYFGKIKENSRRNFFMEKLSKI